MKGYSITKKDKNNANLFWDKLDLITNEIQEFSSKYSRETTNYFEKMYINEETLFKDLSFILNFDDKPLAAFLGNLISKDNNIFIKNFEIPSLFIESKTGLTLKQKKKYYFYIDEILKISCNIREFSGIDNSGKISYGIDYLLNKKLKITKNNYTRKIDLSNSEQFIKSNIRKCYHSLINWGLRELDLKILDSSNIKKEDIMNLRDLHMREAGRITRSKESWIAQYEQIKSSPSFMINGFLNNELVTSGIFACNQNYCFYGVSASRRDLFKKPLFHAPMWKAIIHAKEKGMKIFETGCDYVESNSSKKPSDKESNIAYFKSGFGGRLFQEIIVS